MAIKLFCPIPPTPKAPLCPQQLNWAAYQSMYYSWEYICHQNCIQCFVNNLPPPLFGLGCCISCAHTILDTLIWHLTSWFKTLHQCITCVLYHSLKCPQILCEEKAWLHLIGYRISAFGAEFNILGYPTCSRLDRMEGEGNWGLERPGLGPSKAAEQSRAGQGPQI